jgi:hypothetical protein
MPPVNLWKAAATCLDGRTTKAYQCFALVRHQLRHGEAESVISQLALAIKFRSFPTEVLNTLNNVHDYLESHRDKNNSEFGIRNSELKRFQAHPF